jgi:hypothetical protein
MVASMAGCAVREIVEIRHPRSDRATALRRRSGGGPQSIRPQVLKASAHRVCLLGSHGHYVICQGRSETAGTWKRRSASTGPGVDRASRYDQATAAAARPLQSIIRNTSGAEPRRPASICRPYRRASARWLVTRTFLGLAVPNATKASIRLAVVRAPPMR